MLAKYVLIGLHLMSSITYAQKTTVTGAIKGLRDSKLTIHYYDGEIPKIDTIATKDGNFTWTANMPEPQKVQIVFSGRYMEFIAENGSIKIEGRASGLDNLKISGSSTHDEFIKFTNSNNDLSLQKEQLQNKYLLSSEAEQVEIKNKLKENGWESWQRTIKYIKNNPKSYCSLILVEEVANKLELSELKSTFELLHSSMHLTRQGKMIAERLNVLIRGEVGQDIIDFSLKNTDGKLISISSFKGKYVLIDFWASWCAPCRAAFPKLIQEYNLYKDKKFEIVGISIDNSIDSWRKAILEDKLPWTQLLDARWEKHKVSDYYGVTIIPSTLLIDPNGKIIAKNLQGEALTHKLSEIFN